MVDTKIFGVDDEHELFATHRPLAHVEAHEAALWMRDESGVGFSISYLSSTVICSHI
jgi:hypothetical protein